MSSIFLFWWTSSCWVRLCSSSYVLAQTSPLLFYSGNLIIFSLIVTLFYLYPLLPLNSSLTFSQGSSWHLDLLPSVFSECSGHWSLTLEEPAWDGTFEETHIHPEYFLLIWGASLWRCFSLGGGSGHGTLWQVLCCGCHSAGDRWWKVSRIMNNLDLQLALLSAEGTINTTRSPLQLLSSSFYPFLSPSLLLPILLSISFFSMEARLCVFPSIN